MLIQSLSLIHILLKISSFYQEFSAILKRGENITDALYGDCIPEATSKIRDKIVNTSAMRGKIYVETTRS